VVVFNHPKRNELPTKKGEMTMTKKDFVKKYNLINTHVTGYFLDGTKQSERVIYSDRYGNLFVFYGGDLHTFKLFKRNENKLGSILLGDILAIEGKIGAGYSWYH
jgi:hypothetical protein